MTVSKYIALSKQFPNKLLHEPILQTFKNFSNKPGLTCFKINNPNASQQSTTNEVIVDSSSSESVYVTIWSGGALLQGETVSQCAPHLDYPNEQTHRYVAVIICHGGKFAGSIFNCHTMDEKPLNTTKKHVITESKVHKVFHKYTTRKKQGKRQMNHDKSGGGKSTAGSQIRRNNEKLFQEELEDLLTVWRKDLEQCATIFVHAPGVHNYSQLTDLLPESIPVNTIPFTGVKPTYQQVLLSFKRLMTIHTFDESDFDNIQDLLDEEEVNNGNILRTPDEEDDELIDSGEDSKLGKHRVDYDYYKMISNMNGTPTPGSARSPSSLFDPNSPIGAILSPILTSPKSPISPLFEFLSEIFVAPSKAVSVTPKQQQAPQDLIFEQATNNKSNTMVIEKHNAFTRNLISIIVPAIIAGLIGYYMTKSK
jgi:hypothetical protein